MRSKNPPEKKRSAALVAKGPPDGGWGWLVVFGSFMIHLINDGVTYSFSVLFTEFIAVFRGSSGATAWIASILVGVTLCSGPVASIFVNKYGCRVVTIAGAVLASSCLFVSMFATSLLTLYITIGFGTGLGFGMIYLPAIVSVTCYFEKYRSLATGIAVCGSGLGTFIFAPLIHYLVSNYGWEMSVGVIACLVFMCSLFGMLFRPLPVDGDDDDDDYDGNGNGGGGGCGDEDDGSVPMRAVTGNGVLHVPDIVEPQPPAAESEPLNGSRSFDHIPVSDEEDDRWKKDRRHERKTSHGADADQKLQSRFALSQPELIVAGSNGRLNTGQRNQRYYASQHLKPAAAPVSNGGGGGGIMYQKDIFYSGSMKNIHLNRRRTISQSTNAGNHVGEIACNGGGGNDVSSDGVCCSADAKNTIKHMLDFTLLKDPIFILYTVSNFLTSIGFNIPFLFIMPYATEIGIEKTHGSYLLALLGIANTLGRIILGFVSDKPWINRLMVYNLCLTICGAATLLSVYCTNVLTLSLYVIAFGSTIGAYVGLTSVILVDLLGLDKLTNAFGILLLFQGIASLVGQPMGGWLKDYYGSYRPAFCLAGANIAFSGLMLFVIPSIQKYYERKELEKMTALANHI